MPSKDLFVETWQELERLYAERRARAIGVSNFTPPQLARLLAETGIVPTLNQIELHPGFQQAELRAVHREMGSSPRRGVHSVRVPRCGTR